MRGPDDVTGNLSGILSHALDAVNRAAQWQLSASGWATVHGMLLVVDGALRAGDPDELEASVLELDLLGPRRVIPLGAGPALVPIPPPTRDLLNRLIHDLGEPSEEAVGTDDQEDVHRAQRGGT